MATSEKPAPTSSWADATEDEMDNPPPSKPAGNAWTKGNPWGTSTAPPKEETNGAKGNRYDKDFPDLDTFPPGKSFPKKREDEERGDDRKEETQRDEPYRRPQRDYYEHDDRAPQRRFDDRPRFENRPRDFNRPDERRDFSRPDDRRDFNRPDDRRDDRRDDDRREERRDDGERDFGGRRDERRPFGRGGGSFRDRPERTDRPDRPDRPARDPVPLPTSPPYTAYVGNLSFEAREEDVKNFFERDAKVIHVRLQFDKEYNRSKGYCYVEFDDIESLKNALKLNSEDFFGRPIKIDVAEARPDDRKDTFGSGRGRRAFGTGFRPEQRDRPEGTRPEREQDAEGGEEQDDRKERPKLDLKPRTSASGGAPEPEPSDAYQKKGKSNPFANAKPRDENYFLKKKEEERKQRDSQPKDGDEKSSEGEEREDHGSLNGVSKEDQGGPKSPDRESPRRNDESPTDRPEGGRGPRRDVGRGRDDRPPIRSPQDRDGGNRRDDKFRDRDERRPYGRGAPRDRDAPPRDRDAPLRDRDAPPRDRDAPPRDRDFKRDDRRGPPPRDRDDRPRDRDDRPFIKRDERPKDEKTRSRSDSATAKDDKEKESASRNPYALLSQDD